MSNLFDEFDAYIRAKRETRPAVENTEDTAEDTAEDTVTSMTITVVHGLAEPLEIPVFAEITSAQLLAHPLVRNHFNIGDNAIVILDGLAVDVIKPGATVQITQRANTKA